MDEDAREVARLLRRARQIASLYAETVATYTGTEPQSLVEFGEEVDAYLAFRGWPAEEEPRPEEAPPFHAAFLGDLRRIGRL